MKYIGEFKDLKNSTVEVIIDVPDGDVEIVRMDEEDSEIRLAKDPVQISSEIDDLFQIIEIKQCDISLLAKPYLGGQLFGRNSRDVRVNVWRDNVCVFAGFLEPQVYNQPYNKSWD